VNESRRFDLDYRVTALADAGTAAIQGLGYAYDAADNVLSIADAVAPGNSQALGYDVLNRLTSAAGAYGSLAYAYDKVGNRLQQTLSAAVTTYGYTAGTNRLASIVAGGTATPVGYTLTGNITSIPPTTGAPVATLSYNAANRLAAVTGVPVAISAMVYDAFGQRFTKANPGSNPILYTYDRSGNLLEEADGHGLLIDYVFLNSRPVAEITGGKLYYIHADRLGTPQLVTDGGQNIAWSTTYQPFGTTPIPTGSISQNLRFPGQYFDGETGWNHNGFRDYIPSVGRFVESDLVGLVGGLNTYSYVAANPLSRVDPLGLLDLDFTDPNDPSYASGQAYDNPMYFTFSGHGDKDDPNHIFSRGDGTGNAFDVSTVGDAIVAAGWNGKEPIQALICHGNMGGDNNSFDAQLAHYLANEINADVTIYGSPDNVLPERWHILGTSVYWGGPDPGPSGWSPITKSPYITPISRP
jgi:RHS repeat-associated protein